MSGRKADSFHLTTLMVVLAIIVSASLIVDLREKRKERDVKVCGNLCDGSELLNLKSGAK